MLQRIRAHGARAPGLAPRGASRYANHIRKLEKKEKNREVEKLTEKRKKGNMRKKLFARIASVFSIPLSSVF